MDYSYQARCSCGQVSLELDLPQQIEDYVPRACDCDFCRLHGARYLSDPQGRLSITTHEELTQRTQGSEQARFLSCQNCSSLVAVTYSEPPVAASEGVLIGAVNTNLAWHHSSGAAIKFQPAQPASPRLLSAGEKLARWRTLWLNVKIKKNQNININT